MCNVIMTPGPTKISKNVLEAMQVNMPNNFDIYKSCCEKASKIIKSKNKTYIMCGEALVGLEAACASLTEPGDNVLVISNGVYGYYFDDFVTIYGGVPFKYDMDWTRAIDVKELEKFLEKNHSFKYATLVHHDTPSAMLNDIHVLCPLLKKYGIITVVDAVASMVGDELDTDKAQVDIIIGGSQKAFSAPTGLAMVTISEDAIKSMRNRKVPISGFTTNLLKFIDLFEKGKTPYALPMQLICALDKACDNILSQSDVVKKHKDIAKACRSSITEAGLELYGKNGYSNCCTAICVPEGKSASQIIEKMEKQYSVAIGGSFERLDGKVIRIGHMGENCNVEDMLTTMKALDETLRSFGFNLKVNLYESFKKHL